IEAAILASVQPEYINPPEFKSSGEPKIVIGDDGKVRLDYAFNVEKNGLRDTSVINWYRVNTQGNKIPLAVSRLNKPEQEYTLSEGDVGHHLVAEITPKYNVSEFSTATLTVKSSRAIAKKDVQIRLNT